MKTVAELARISRLRKLRDIEREWMDERGGTLAGYMLRYGSKESQEHYGDGGEAIYAADKAALDRAQAKLDEALMGGAWGQGS